jgi:hypothetical protein
VPGFVQVCSVLSIPSVARPESEIDCPGPGHSDRKMLSEMLTQMTELTLESGSFYEVFKFSFRIHCTGDH